MKNKPGRLSTGLLLALHTGLAAASDRFNLLPPQTRITADNFDLHVLMMYVILVVFCAVFGVMLYSIYAHRRSAGHQAEQFHQSITVEIIWTVIPFIILLGTAWPAASALLGLKASANADITIKATGMQWKWGYDYLKGDGEGISYFSNLRAARKPAADSTSAASSDNLIEVDNPVVVPVNKTIRMILSANDAIHSWHVPGLGVKQDAVPGLARDTWFNAQKVGTYRGLCSTEACGAGRACVLIVVNVVSDDDYRKWVAGRKKDMAANADVPAWTPATPTQRDGRS